ncbi:response regulator transcription factor [Shewanella sp. AS1]|uniref:response regulator transcription factor n=1 Tax=Shewanella sp. AS1 TaxID=2907626 RepID=UPI001F406B31|nr:response regulator transcription factor [Shewanella sp. AS1]MCE9679818.1 response regulator transcription factor [Shewanella sp. AS1]
MKLLLIEDSEPLRRGLMVGLQNLGYRVDEAADGEQGLAMALSLRYDLIVLDLMLPKMNGLQILAEIRQKGLQIKVLILSAKSEVKDKIDGLMQGADDYLAKPFSFEELHARIIALTRRGELTESTSQGEVNGFRIDGEKKRLTYQQQEIELTPHEFRVVECIFNARGRVVSLEQISDALVGEFDYVSKNTIESHLSAVRRKVREKGAVLPIKNKRGFGYIVEVL